jgi:hypothetical protein
MPLHLSSSSVRTFRAKAFGLYVMVGVLCLPIVAAAGDDPNKKKAPPPTNAPAPRPAGVAPGRPVAAPAPSAGTRAPAGGGRTVTTPTGVGAGGPATAHGPSTGAGGTAAGGHAITTSNPGRAPAGTAPAGGPSTGMGGVAAGRHSITTSNPGGAQTGVKSAQSGGASTTGHVGVAGASSSSVGHPRPAGVHEVHLANGAAVRTRADGSRSDVHDPKRAMDIHHGLNGNRRISVERADHSRVVAERGGRGYVQRPYMFHGREFGHRTYFEHGRAYDRFYGRYPYHGRYLEVYAPARYYRYGFYGYAYAPWVTPVPYAWGYGAAPWYGYYGAYYAPYPVYAGPTFWLTDFVIAASLQAAYAARTADSNPAQSTVGPAEAGATTALNPETKQIIADEVRLQLQQEATEAQANAAKQDADPGNGSIVHVLSDNQPHVFVSGSDLDLVTASGQECTCSQGDVLRVMSAPPPNFDTASATILASKGGGRECGPGDTVSVAMTDLQDMHNHMRETIDDGLSELQSKQGKNGLPATPSSAVGAPTGATFVAGAPPLDANADSEISQQSNEADRAEREASTSAPAAPAASSGSSVTIALGQTTDQVTAALGNPPRIIDLGAKKIYTYPDMKIIFQNGKVSDVQ